MSKPSLAEEQHYRELSKIQEQRMQLTDDELQEFDERLDAEMLTELEEVYE